MGNKKNDVFDMRLVLAILAIVGVSAAAYFAFIHAPALPAAAPAAQAKFSWDSMAAPVPASSDSPSAVEITVYQTQSTSSDYRYWSNSYIPTTTALSYNPSDGIALVKELRSTNFATGPVSFSMANVPSHIDPSSLHLTDFAGTLSVIEQNYDYDLVSGDKLLEKYVGSNITLTSGNTTSSGILLSPTGPVLQTDDGIKVFSSYDTLSFPKIPEGLVTKPTINWLLNSNTAGTRDVQVSYLTSGLNWDADYVAVVNKDDTSASLQAWISLRNDAGISFKDDKLKLMAGDVNLVQNQGVPAAMYDMAYSAGAKSSSSVTETPFFEYHLYTLDRPTTIANGQVKQIEMASADNVGVNKEYVFDSGASNYYSYGSSSTPKVAVKLSLQNSESNGLGIPLPKGKVRVYKEDADGQLEFVGEDSIDHTPANETVRLTLGNAFDIVGEHTQTDTQSIGSCGSRYSYSITLRNHKTEDVNVKVVEHSYGNWDITTSSQAYTKESSTQFSFDVPVPANGASTVTYTIENNWC